MVPVILPDQVDRVLYCLIVFLIFDINGHEHVLVYILEDIFKSRVMVLVLNLTLVFLKFSITEVDWHLRFKLG
jgi:hypothetical protein